MRKLEAIERIARVFRVAQAEKEARTLRREIEEGGRVSIENRRGRGGRGYPPR